MLDIGHILRRLPQHRRPDRILGPESWHKSLGYPASAGFRPDGLADADHLHLGFSSMDDTTNTE